MGGKRKTREDASWTITFDDSSALRSVVDAAASIMPRIVFKLAKAKEEHDQYYLMVDGGDTSQTCWIHARLLVHDKLQIHSQSASEFEFCVECRHLLIAMDSATLLRGTLLLQGIEADAKLCVSVVDEDRPATDEYSLLDTYEFEQPQQLRDMSFRLTAEIDNIKMKDIIKKARKTHAEHLRIAVQVFGAASVKHSLVRFFIDGDFKHVQSFSQDVIEGEDGNMIVRAATEESTNPKGGDAGEAPMFDNRFPVDKVEAFVKNVQGGVLTAMMEQNMPLIFVHDLGDGKSRVRFLIGPVVD